MIRAEQLTVNSDRNTIIKLKSILVDNNINFYTKIRTAKKFTQSLLLVFEIGNRIEQFNKIRFYKLLEQNKELAAKVNIKLDILTREF